MPSSIRCRIDSALNLARRTKRACRSRARWRDHRGVSFNSLLVGGVLDETVLVPLSVKT